MADITAVNPGNSDYLNRSYYDSLVITTRIIDSVLPTTETTLFGHKLKMPIMTAALSRMNEACENGWAKLSEAVKILDTVLWIGIGGKEELEEITASGAKAIKIIKPYADREIIIDEIKHARKCGALAVGVDIDHIFSPAGKYEGTREKLPLGPISSDDIRRYSEAACDIPFIVKGVLSAEDAVKSREAGAGAVVVSHHHGRTEFSVPPIMILPEIRRAVGEDFTVIADSNITSGIDAFKALARGADAVCVGRPLVPILKKDGTDGIVKYFSAMNAALLGVMAKTGYPSPTSIDQKTVRKL